MRAVLFDLDGTLLAIDLSSFIERYFAALSNALGEVLPSTHPSESLRAVHSATAAMMREHTGRTNQEVFEREFAEVTGVDLAEHREVFDRFYHERFPQLGDGYGPAPGARAAVDAARTAGLRVAVATNPIFPRAAVVHRMGWAGLKDDEFDVITSYETMVACKPMPGYFRQTATALDVAPVDCMMVGDDRMLDLAAADVGMSTFYVGDDPDARADYRGDLESLARLIPQLAPDSRG